MARFSRFRLQQLEPRDCPSVSVLTSDNGRTLSITGDKTAESIAVVQNDTSNTLQVSVSPAGSTSPATLYQFTSSSIRTLDVDLGGGNDTLTYSLGGSDLTYRKDIQLNTGSGNVSANFDFASGGASLKNNLSVEVKGGNGQDGIKAEFGTIKNDASIVFQTALGAGNDAVDVELQGNLNSGSAVHINLTAGKGTDQLKVGAADVAVASGAELAVNEAAGAGSDRLDFEYSGEMDGLLSARLVGGAGGNNENAVIAEAYDSTGSAYVWVFGGSGNDTLTLSMYRELPIGNQVPSSRDRMSGWIFGGKGTDTAYYTAGVRVRGCEKLDPLAVIV